MANSGHLPEADKSRPFGAQRSIPLEVNGVGASAEPRCRTPKPVLWCPRDAADQPWAPVGYDGAGLAGADASGRVARDPRPAQLPEWKIGTSPKRVPLPS